MSHVKSVTIRELKHETAKVLASVAEGEVVEVRRRKKPVAPLSPTSRVRPVAMPDFAKRLRIIYGDRILTASGTELVAEARGDRSPDMPIQV